MTALWRIESSVYISYMVKMTEYELKSIPSSAATVHIRCIMNNTESIFIEIEGVVEIRWALFLPGW